MSIVHFVRHGQGTLGGGDYDNLSELGRTQARQLGEMLVERGLRFGHTLCGTQKRHNQTAEIVAGCYHRAGIEFPEIETDTRFNEIDSYNVIENVIQAFVKTDDKFARLARKSREALKNNLPEKFELFDELYIQLMKAWMSGRFPEIEAISWDDFCITVLGAQSNLRAFADDAHVAVFTSANPIGVFIKEALSLSNTRALDVMDNIYNTSISTFALSHDGLSLKNMNVTTHLRADQVTRK